MDASEYDPTKDWRSQFERWRREAYGGEEGYNEDGIKVEGAFRYQPLSIQQPSASTLPTDLAAYTKGLVDAGADEATVEAAKRQYLEAYMPTFNVGEFDDLLTKLEGSKMKQAEQKGRIDLLGTLNQGLASMMRNF